jgi:2-methylisocitrate lyase-like PEP mutase family enzyme
MDDTKSLLASKTIWGALLAIAASVAGALGFAISGDDQTAALGLVDQIFAEWDRIAALVGGILALYGRIRATRRIG